MIGPAWLVFRVGYALKVRLGLLRHWLPVVAWEARPLSVLLDELQLAEPNAYVRYRLARAPAFFFAPDQRAHFAPILARWDARGGGPVSRADDLGRGVMRYFSHTLGQIGYPPAWNVNPLTGQTAPVDRHW
jgi:hypothetical protein